MAEALPRVHDVSIHSDELYLECICLARKDSALVVANCTMLWKLSVAEIFSDSLGGTERRCGQRTVLPRPR